MQTAYHGSLRQAAEVEVWEYTATSSARNWDALGRPVRSVTLKSIRAYEAVSTETTLILSGLIRAAEKAVEKANVAT